VDPIIEERLTNIMPVTWEYLIFGVSNKGRTIFENGPLVK